LSTLLDTLNQEGLAYLVKKKTGKPENKKSFSFCAGDTDAEER
jgi:hypothetical protein